MVDFLVGITIGVALGVLFFGGPEIIRKVRDYFDGR